MNVSAKSGIPILVARLENTVCIPTTLSISIAKELRSVRAGLTKTNFVPLWHQHACFRYGPYAIPSPNIERVRIISAMVSLLRASSRVRPSLPPPRSLAPMAAEYLVLACRTSGVSRTCFAKRGSAARPSIRFPLKFFKMSVSDHR